MSISGSYCQHAGACSCGGNESQGSHENNTIDNRIQDVAQGANGIDGKPYDCSGNGAGISTGNNRRISKRKKSSSGGSNEPRVVDVERIDSPGCTTIILIRKNS